VNDESSSCIPDKNPAYCIGPVRIVRTPDTGSTRSSGISGYTTEPASPLVVEQRCVFSHSRGKVASRC